MNNLLKTILLVSCASACVASHDQIVSANNRLVFDLNHDPVYGLYAPRKLLFNDGILYSSVGHLFISTVWKKAVELNYNNSAGEMFIDSADTYIDIRDSQSFAELYNATVLKGNITLDDMWFTSLQFIPWLDHLYPVDIYRMLQTTVSYYFKYDMYVRCKLNQVADNKIFIGKGVWKQNFLGGYNPYSLNYYGKALRWFKNKYKITGCDQSDPSDRDILQQNFR